MAGRLGEPSHFLRLHRRENTARTNRPVQSRQGASMTSPAPAVEGLFGNSWSAHWAGMAAVEILRVCYNYCAILNV